MIMKHIIVWAIFTLSAFIGAWLSQITFGAEIEMKFIFGFSLGVAFMQGWNYEMNNKGKDQ